ncbi:MAG: QueT transporter family protein [Bacilli bacterium]|jgi:uncharacterized membrane protein|nr:QueT transporter family protein [Bacilli bacterium]
MATANLTKKICQNGIVAAVYFVLTLAFSGFAYGQIQFRIAEMLVLLCFFRPDFVFGVTLGCFLANINSTLGPYDMLIGTAATFLSSLLLAYASPRLAVGCLYPIVFNAFIVAGELTWLLGLPYWANVAYVGLGEASVVVAAYALMLALIRNKGFMAALGPSRHAGVKW